VEPLVFITQKSFALNAPFGRLAVDHHAFPGRGSALGSVRPVAFVRGGRGGSPPLPAALSLSGTDAALRLPRRGMAPALRDGKSEGLRRVMVAAIMPAVDGGAGGTAATGVRRRLFVLRIGAPLTLGVARLFRCRFALGALGDDALLVEGTRAKLLELRADAHEGGGLAASGFCWRNARCPRSAQHRALAEPVGGSGVFWQRCGPEPVLRVELVRCLGAFSMVQTQRKGRCS